MDSVALRPLGEELLGVGELQSHGGKPVQV